MNKNLLSVLFQSYIFQSYFLGLVEWCWPCRSMSSWLCPATFMFMVNGSFCALALGLALHIFGTQC